MKNAIILRGIQGSGKSTFIKNYLKDINICSADNFFMSNGTYLFDFNLLHLAHKKCFEDFQNYIINSQDVVVDNTNITSSSYKKYIDLAKQYDYNIIIIEFDGSKPPEYYANRNLHNVSLDKIKEIILKYKPTNCNGVKIYRQKDDKFICYTQFLIKSTNEIINVHQNEFEQTISNYNQQDIQIIEFSWN